MALLEKFPEFVKFLADAKAEGGSGNVHFLVYDQETSKIICQTRYSKTAFYEMKGGLLIEVHAAMGPNGWGPSKISPRIYIQPEEVSELLKLVHEAGLHYNDCGCP